MIKNATIDSTPKVRGGTPVFQKERSDDNADRGNDSLMGLRLEPLKPPTYPDEKGRLKQDKNDNCPEDYEHHLAAGSRVESMGGYYCA